MIDSSMTIMSTLNRLAPMARSMPISLVLSETDITMTNRVTIPATINMTALMPLRNVLVFAIISSMLLRRSWLSDDLKLRVFILDRSQETVHVAH